MPKLSIKSVDYDALVYSGARVVTVKNITLFSGSCQASVVASGGSVPNGIYYYKVTVLTGSNELVTPSQSAAVAVATSGSKVYLSWDSVTGSTGYNVYRATATKFASPSYLGTTGSNNFFDNSGSTFTGAPTGSTAGGSAYAGTISGGGSIINMYEIEEEWAVFDKNPKDIHLDEGFRYEDYRYAYTPSSSPVKFHDIIRFDNTDFIVTGVTSIVVGDQRVAVKAHLRRLSAQKIQAQSE